jgi:hypothetical protein
VTTYVGKSRVQVGGSIDQQRWPIGAVTGTMAEQRRDDEAGVSGFPATLVVSRSTKAALATARSES